MLVDGAAGVVEDTVRHEYSSLFLRPAVAIIIYLRAAMECAGGAGAAASKGLPSASRRPLHILLGVSGSVAAVKAPEIAVQLARSAVPCLVRVLLTKGGTVFWNKAQRYNPVVWDELRIEISKERVVVLGELLQHRRVSRDDVHAILLHAHVVV